MALSQFECVPDPAVPMPVDDAHLMGVNMEPWTPPKKANGETDRWMAGLALVQREVYRITCVYQRSQLVRRHRATRAPDPVTSLR